MKKLKRFILSLFTLLLLVACSNTKDITLTQVEPASDDGIEALENILELNKGQLYGVSTKNKNTYIFYYMSINPESVTMNLEKDLITIQASTDNDDEGIYYYDLNNLNKDKPEQGYTIEILIDNEAIPVTMIISE